MSDCFACGLPTFTRVHTVCGDDSAIQLRGDQRCNGCADGESPPQPHANDSANRDLYADRDTQPDPDADTNPHANPDADTDDHLYTVRDPYTHANRFADTDGSGQRSQCDTGSDVDAAATGRRASAGRSLSLATANRGRQRQLGGSNLSLWQHCWPAAANASGG